MIYEHTDYRTYLRALLAEKIGKNPSYSLRALAQSLKVAPSTLSEVMKGSANLSHDKASQMASRLGLETHEQEYFCTLVQYGNAKSSELKIQLERKLSTLNPERAHRDLSLDAFRVIAEWYHFPIMEMTKLSRKVFQPGLVAKRLGISKAEVVAAIDRLLRLELIEEIAPGQFKRTQNHWMAQSASPNESLRKFHKQMLMKAMESLENQDANEKWIGSETLAVNKKDLKSAKPIFERFFNELIAHFNKSPSRTDVYHLGVQFFNLTLERSPS